MHYCKKRGRTQCCFQNEECEENWIEINDKVNVNVFKNQNMHSHLLCSDSQQIPDVSDQHEAVSGQLGGARP